MNITGIFGEIIGAVVGLSVANGIPSWHIPVIIPDLYLLYLPYINTAIILTAITKILMYLSPWYRLRMIFEGVTESIGLYTMYMLLTIFPFDFSTIGKVQINELLRFGCTIVIIILGITFLITCFRILRGKP